MKLQILAVLALILSGCSTGLTTGDTALIEYIGTFPSGEEFDSSSGKPPLEVTLGSRSLIPGFEQALYGMKVGDSKDIVIQPIDAYGVVNPGLIFNVPNENLREPVKVNDIIIVSLADGSQSQGKVLSLNEETVTVDLNHPLAGKVLNFNIKIVG